MPKQQKVKVVVRVRPNLNSNESVCVRAEKNRVEIFNHRNVEEIIQYEFAAVFTEDASQQQVYNDSVKELVPRVLDGQNVSVFAYGPTGAGKTHTMLGTRDDAGVIPRVVRELFTLVGQGSTQLGCNDNSYNTDHNIDTCNVTFSYLEIYNEKVLDLLQTKSCDLPIREDFNKNIFVAGLTERRITTFDEFNQQFDQASSRRTVASTNLNNRSSRSHSIVLLKVDTVSVNNDSVTTTSGKFYLIDLAGSEDNKRTGNTGLRLRESGAINKSLFALGEVVDAINTKLPRIPYRNSKLTRLLQDSLGGNSHCVMITNIAPEERFYFDTFCTLNLASKSKKIVNNTSFVRTTIDRKRKILIPDSVDSKKVRLTSTESTPSVSPDIIYRDSSDFSDTPRIELGGHPIKREDPDCLTPRSQKIADLEVALARIQRELEQRDTTRTPVKRNILSDRTNMQMDTAPMESPDCIPPTPHISATVDHSVKGKQKFPLYIDKEAQQRHNKEVLHVINTGFIKDLKCLQTIGDKRAQLIYSWRQVHGAFTRFEDLKNIDGFTSAMLQRFLKSNLVTLPCP